MKSKKDFLYALEQAKEVVRHMQPQHMQLPTPDTEWTVSDLFHHMLYELCWASDVIMGAELETVGDRYEGDIVGEDPHASWHAAYIRAREAVRMCDVDGVAHLSYGDRTVRYYLQEAGVDQLVHAWDLGKGIGYEVVFDEAVAKTMYGFMSPRRKELAASGLFAKPIHVPASATYHVKLLALLGRSANWKP